MDNEPETVRCFAVCRDITPDLPISLAGYFGRVKQSNTVVSPLELNLAVISGPDAEPVFILQGDVLSMGMIPREAARAAGIPDERFLSVASHTHFAPAVDEALPLLGSVDTQYLSRFREILTGMFDEAIAKFETAQACRFFYSEVGCELAINRRKVIVPRNRFGWPKIPRMSNHPNEKGPTDNFLKMIVVRRVSDGLPVSILWSFACHPVAYPKMLSVTSEFIGHVRERLRKTVGEKISVVYLPGLMGNQRPRLLSPNYPGLLGAFFARVNGPRFHCGSVEDWEKWANLLADKAASALETAAPIETTGRLSAAHITVPLANFAAGAKTREVDFQVIDIEGVAQIVSVSAEPVVELGALFKQVFTADRVLATGYTDSIFGYIPVTSMLAEKGYEDMRFRTAFSLPSLKFYNDLNDRFVKSLSALKLKLDGCKPQGGN